MDNYFALLVDSGGGQAVRMVKALVEKSFMCHWEPTPDKALMRLSRRQYDLLFACESEFDGWLEQFCLAARRRDPKMTIIASMSNQHSGLEERLLDAVDDVVTISTPASVALKRAMVRLRSRSHKARPPKPANQYICLGDAVVDFTMMEVRNNGRSGRLSKGLARLLRYLLANRNRPVTRRDAASAVWANSRVDPQGRNLDMQVMKLRRLIENDPRRPAVLKTVRGVGYVLILPNY